MRFPADPSRALGLKEKTIAEEAGNSSISRVQTLPHPTLGVAKEALPPRIYIPK